MNKINRPEANIHGQPASDVAPATEAGAAITETGAELATPCHGRESARDAGLPSIESERQQQQQQQ